MIFIATLVPSLSIPLWTCDTEPDPIGLLYIYLKLDVNSVVDEANTPEGQAENES